MTQRFWLNIMTFSIAVAILLTMAVDRKLNTGQVSKPVYLFSGQQPIERIEIGDSVVEPHHYTAWQEARIVSRENLLDNPADESWYRMRVFIKNTIEPKLYFARLSANPIDIYDPQVQMQYQVMLYEPTAP